MVWSPSLRPWRALLVTSVVAASSTTTAVAIAEPPRFVKGPYLQGLTPTSVVVRWEGSEAADAVVTVTERAAIGKRIERRSTSETRFHSQRVEELSPGTTYGYEVTSAGITSTAGTFTTPRNDDERFTFQVYGDNRSDHAAHAAVVAQMRKRKADFGIHTGDMVLSGGKPEEWSKFFEIETPLLRDRCVYACIGNHELIDGGMPSFLRYFHPGMHGEPTLTYTVRWGSARFFFLNAFATSLTTTDRAWLERELNDADGEQGLRHRFIVMHQGPSSSGPHGGGQFFDDGLRKMLLAHKITMVFAGHDHLYERGVRDGLRYIVSGGGGAPLYPSKPEKSQPTQAAESAHHFVSVDVDGAKITTTAIRKDGSTLDRCYLEGESFTCDKTAIEVAKDPLTGANVAWPPKRRACDCAVPGHPQGSPVAGGLASLLVGIAVFARRARHRLASRRRRLLPSASMSKRPTPPARSRRSRLPSFFAGASAVIGLTLASTAATGCATYTQDLDRGIKHYDANEHERALAVFRSLENDTDSFAGKELARYYYYRGMTDYRLATPEYEVRPDARYWLGLAHAAEEKTPGSLSEEQKKRLGDAMADLNDDVYGTGNKAKGAAEPAGEKKSEPKAKKSDADAKLQHRGNKRARRGL